MTTPRRIPDKSAPAPAVAGAIDGCTLETYAAICREVVRAPHGADREARIITAHGVDGRAWPRIREGWAERIARDDAVRAAFRRLYAPGPRTKATPGNE